MKTKRKARDGLEELKESTHLGILENKLSLSLIIECHIIACRYKKNKPSKPIMINSLI